MPSTNVKGTGDFSDLNKNIQNTAKLVGDLGLKLSGISAAGKAFDMVTGAIGGTINALGKIGLAAQGIEAIGKSAVAMGMGLVQGNAQLEMVTISFQTLLGSASAAQDMLKQLTAFAETTPFELQGLEANTQRLLAFGFSAQDIIPIMTSLGDAISALGGTQDNLNSLVYVMGQMRAEAHINAGDIMQMVNLGIPALQMLADHYHKTTGEIQEMISKGLIPGKDAVQILTDAMEKQYGGMMAAQSTTFNGMLSNLQDWAKATTITLTKPLFDPAKKALKALLDFVQSPAGVAAVNKLAGYIQMGVDKMTKAFVEFEPKIRPTFQRILQIAEALRGQFTPGIITLLPHLTELWKRIEPIALGIYKFYEAIQPLNIALAAFRGYLTGGLSGALVALQTRFTMLRGYVTIALNAVMGVLRQWGPTLLSWASDLAIALARKALQWGEALIQWVAPYAIKLVGAAINLGEALLDWVIDFAPVLARQLFFLGIQLVNWVVQAIPRVLNALLGFATLVLNWAEGELPILTREFLKWTDILVGWVIPAIPGVIRSLEQVGMAVLNWGITRLPQIIGQIVVGVGRAFGLNLRPAVNDVLMVFNSLVRNITTTVIPAFRQMISYLSLNVMPLINRLAFFTAQTLIPTMASLAAFVMTTVVPAFVTATDLLSRIFGPSLTLIGNIIRNELLPALSDSWQFVDRNYMPTIRDLADTLGQRLAGGIRLAVDKFKDAWPVLETFYQKIKPIAEIAFTLWQTFSPLSLAIDIFKGFLQGGIQGALGVISDKFAGLKDILGNVLDWVVKNGPTLFNNLMSWAGEFGNMALKAIDAMMPKLQTLLIGLINFITTNAPIVLNTLLTWAEKFGDWLVTAIVRMMPHLADLFGSLVSWVAARGPEILTKLLDWAIQFGNMVLQIWPKMYQQLPKLFDSIVGWIKAQSPRIASTVVDWAAAIVGWIVNDAIPTWFREAPKLWSAILQFIGDVAFKIRQEMPTWVNAFQKWVSDTISNMPSNVASIVSSIWSSITNNKQSLFNIGDLLGYYIVNGLKNSPLGLVIGWLNDAANLVGIKGRLPGYATGTTKARKGLALVGEKGAELIKDNHDKLMLVTQPMLVNFKGGEQVYNNRETRQMLPNPASAQQISNMYATSYANRSWDYSQDNRQVNSNNNTYYVNGQQSNQWSFGQAMRWYNAR